MLYYGKKSVTNKRNNMAGKGSKPRPFSDKKKFDENWDMIFGKKKEPEKQPKEDKIWR